MSQISIVLLGGGGHCHSVIESIEKSGEFRIEGISEPSPHTGATVCGYPVMATDDDIPRLAELGHAFLITIGHIRNPLPRQKLFELLKSLNANIVKVIDPTAVVSERAVIGEGTVILRHAFVNAGAEIGSNCIINTGAMVEHDSKIGNHVHISTGAIVNGDCTIGDKCFIGSGAIISNNLSICENTMVGAGAVVLNSITKSGTYLGNPASFIK